MTNLATNANTNPFDAIRYADEDGVEYWLARDLMPILGYQQWRQFEDAVLRAIAACENTGNDCSKHFLRSTAKTTKGGRPGLDFKLSRYGAYLTAMNGDPRKREIAAAQTYFVTKTREAETVIPQQSERLRELELQLALTQAETQKAIAEKSILDTRHLIVTTCPEPIQQKILGYKSVNQIEYRDRIIHGEQIIHDGSTITKTELCRRYGFLSKTGAPDFKKLKQHLSGYLPSEAWELKARIQDTEELRREYLEEVDQLIIGGDRQTWIGEGGTI